MFSSLKKTRNYLSLFWRIILGKIHWHLGNEVLSVNFELLHNGKNILDSIKLSSCDSYDRYGGVLDNLQITFSTEENTIEFNENDEIEIRTVGGFSTGIMYLDSCKGDNGKFTLMALSCRHKNKKRKSKIWHRVKLSKLIEDVARNTGLTPLLYGIEDYTYESVSQINETDLQFLARICKREGYSIKCDNGNLIVFNEFYLENNNNPIKLSKVDVKNNYSFTRNPNGLSSFTVRCFNTESKQNISYTSTDNNVSGGEDNIIEFMSNINEAQRFSKGYLRDANKLYITGVLELAYNGNISAGTVSDLTDFEEFDGRYVVYEVRNDFIREKTTIKVRKTLNY